MRRSTLIAAFLATTALTPSPVHAAPVVGFIAGALGVASGTGLAATAAYAAGAAFTGTAIGGFVVKATLAIGLSALAAKLQPKPSIPPPAARMANFAQPISYAEWVFGRTRKGGPLGFTGFAASRRYYVPILAAHPIEGAVEHWLDEKIVTLTGATTGSNITGGGLDGYGRIDVFTGGAGQVANADLVARFPEVTEEFDFAGLSGAYVWAARPNPEDFTALYPRGREWAYAPVIDGCNRIYDPRDGSTGYTSNAALVLAYWLTEILGREVDWDEVAQEANASDATVNSTEFGPLPRWTLNGTISDDQEFEDQRAQMAAACDAFVYERTDGKVGFKVGRWIVPTVTLGPDDFLSLEITEGNWGADAPTEVACTYVEPQNAWRETPSGAWVEDATARPVRDEPALYMITNHNQATRINRRLARMKRARYRISGTMGPIGYELIGQRFFRVQHAALGLDAYFEVGELTREGVATFSISANSVEPSDFADDIVEPERPAYDAVTSDNAVPDLSGLVASAVAGGALDFEWDAQDESLTQQIRIVEQGGSDWQIVTVPEGQQNLRVTGLRDGVTYEYQGRNRTAALRVGEWYPETPDAIAVVVNSTPPDALAGFSVTLSGSDVDIAFTAPNDANYFATRIYRAPFGDPFGSATLVRTEYGIPSNADSWTDVAPGSGAKSYWAEPINQSGVAGALEGPETVSVP